MYVQLVQKKKFKKNTIEVGSYQSPLYSMLNNENESEFFLMKIGCLGFGKLKDKKKKGAWG